MGDRIGKTILAVPSHTVSTQNNTQNKAFGQYANLLRPIACRVIPGCRLADVLAANPRASSQAETVGASARGVDISARQSAASSPRSAGLENPRLIIFDYFQSGLAANSPTGGCTLNAQAGER